MFYGVGDNCQFIYHKFIRANGKTDKQTMNRVIALWLLYNFFVRKQKQIVFVVVMLSLLFFVLLCLFSPYQTPSFTLRLTEKLTSTRNRTLCQICKLLIGVRVCYTSSVKQQFCDRACCLDIVTLRDIKPVLNCACVIHLCRFRSLLDTFWSHFYGNSVNDYVSMRPS